MMGTSQIRELCQHCRVRWNTRRVGGLTVPETASVFVSRLSPLTGPYVGAPATIQIE